MYTLCSLIYFYTSNLQIGFFYPHQKIQSSSFFSGFNSTAA